MCAMAHKPYSLRHLLTIVGIFQLLMKGKFVANWRHFNQWKANLGTIVPKTHGTFEDYCRDRWNMGRTYAHYLIESSKVINNVHNCEQIPANERQIRPLTKLEPELQKEAWTKVVETAPEGKITARHLSAIVKEMKDEEVKKNEKGCNKERSYRNALVKNR